MFNRIHTYTTSRITPKAVALLAVYAAVIEYIARLFTLITLFSYGLYIGAFSLLEFLLTPVFAVWFGHPLLLADLYAASESMTFYANIHTEDMVVMAAVVFLSYAASIGVVYKLHHRYLSD